MEAAKVEVNLKDMSFYEFAEDIRNLPLILKLISELSLEVLEQQRVDAYNKLTTYLELEWDTDLKDLTSAERGYELYNRKKRKQLVNELRKTHNKLRKEALLTFSVEMHNSFAENATELNDIVIKKWRNRRRELLDRTRELDDDSYGHISDLIESLKFSSKRILWVYQDKAFAQFDLFQKKINREIEACEI